MPCSPHFTCDSFLSNPTSVRQWNIQGLPSDNFSTENGIIVTRGNRCGGSSGVGGEVARGSPCPQAGAWLSHWAGVDAGSELSGAGGP